MSFVLAGPYIPPGSHMSAHYGALRAPGHMPQMLIPTHGSVMDSYGNMSAMHSSGIHDIHAS